MNTVTICDASIHAHYRFHDACVAIAGGNLSADDCRRAVVRAYRLQRQCRAFDAALRMDVEQFAMLKHMIHVQAQIINRKNDEIARLNAALAHAQSHDYADDLMLDCEAGAIAGALDEVTR